MIGSFRSKALADLWSTGSTRRIDARMHARVMRRLLALDDAKRAEDMNLPGFNFHALHSFDPIRYTVHVNGPWCVTFEFIDGKAQEVDYEQYH
jgi:toxin HigB-1